MVAGMETFREAFYGYEDCYTIIGGTACDILMNNAHLAFRATRDIDMILLIENRFEEFGEVLWKFIKDGAYRCGWKSSDMIITPLHVSDEISSLSAIMLNDDYYEFMIRGRKVVDGVGTLGAEHLIPFKMRAWLDLCRRKSEGEHVNSADIKKHKNDVFRLMNIINPDEAVTVPETVKDDIRQFIERMPEERINMKNIGLDMELEDALQVLMKVYGIYKNT